MGHGIGSYFHGHPEIWHHGKEVNLGAIYWVESEQGNFAPHVPLILNSYDHPFVCMHVCVGGELLNCNQHITMLLD